MSTVETFLKPVVCAGLKDFNEGMDAGQVWAYRERARSTECRFERVEYVQAAPKGKKCLVRFLDRDGREEWVPQGRLIVLWDDSESRLEHERRMAAVVEVSAHAAPLPAGLPTRPAAREPPARTTPARYSAP
ncbi:hypothetical protein SMC26_17615 [Actinomadura fulvescens]